MNDIMIFNNEDFGQIRTVEIDNKIYFCGKDVASALGYKRERDAISSHCKGAVKYSIPTNGGNQEMQFITEGDVYRLITKSKLPSAEKFETWVFDEVLPEIRKSGSYSIKTDSYLIDDPIKRAERWIEEQKQKLALEIKVKEQEPFVELANMRYIKRGTSISDLNEMYGIKNGSLLRWARANGFIHAKRNEVNKAGREYFHSILVGTSLEYKNVEATQRGVIYVGEHLDDIAKFDKPKKNKTK